MKPAFVETTTGRGIVAAFGPNGKFLHSALAAFGVREAVAFFEAEGVATKVEETGKIFPVSDRALRAAIEGSPVSGPTKTRIVRAVNRLLEQKKQEQVGLRELF